MLFTEAQQKYSDRSVTSCRCFKSKRSTQQKTQVGKNSTLHWVFIWRFVTESKWTILFFPPQSQTGEEVHAEKGANKPEEELQYVDINFFKRTPEAPSDSVQESGQLETVYAQVKAPDAGNRKYSVDWWDTHFCKFVSCYNWPWYRQSNMGVVVWGFAAAIFF